MHTKEKLKRLGEEVYSEDEHGAKLIACCDIALNTNKEEDQANAQLIASAPELLFYLKDLIEQIEQFPQISKGINMSCAEQAINKAEQK